MSEVCPCKGKHGWSWHASKKIPQCDHSRLQKRIETRRRNGVPEWIPGTLIRIPEYEEP